MSEALSLAHGTLDYPGFLPDATRGVVRTVDASDLERCGIQALMMSVFHLMQRPGSSTIRAVGGLHALTGWTGPIATDSGGFQAYSLIRQNPRYGSLSDRGLHFRAEGGRKYLLTPEKSVQLQMNYGADLIFCLDDCTHPSDPTDVQQRSVERTVAWARRCRAAFDRIVEQKGLTEDARPRLFAVVQGGRSADLRRRCAEALLEVGFDGFGYGGWPLDSEGHLMDDMLALTRELIPATFPLHALGVGHPDHVARCVAMGYQLFDSSLPTRDARQGRLYILQEDGSTDYCYVQDKKHVKANRPLDPTCDALCCRRYSLAYLHHLFQIRDGLAYRLATIHNLRFMVRLMQRLREEKKDGPRRVPGNA